MITIRTHQLKQLLQRSATTIGNAKTLPILNHVLLHTENGELRASTSNLNAWLTITAPTETCPLEPIRVCVSHKTLSELVNNFPPDSLVELRPEENRKLIVQAERARYTLLGLPPEEFPTAPQPEDPKAQWNMPLDIFRQLIERVQFAASKEEYRPALCAVRLEYDPNRGFRTIATDTHRLAVYNRNDTEPLVTQMNEYGLAFLFPTEQLRILNALDNGTAEFILDEQKRLAIRTDHSEATITLIEGQYPNYERVIPTEYVSAFRLDTRALRDALQRIRVVTTDTPKVYVSLTDPTTLTLRANSKIGDGDETVPVETITQPGNTPQELFAMNINYLLSALNMLSDAKEVYMLGEAPLRPVIFADAIEPNHRKQFCIVMPMAL